MSEYASDYVASLSDDYIEWKSAEERTKKDIFGIMGKMRCHVANGAGAERDYPIQMTRFHSIPGERSSEK